MDGVLVGDPAGVGVAARIPAFPRNGAAEASECAHMLCREAATAVLLFDPRVATAWLVNVEGAAPRGLPMCTSHAGRFRPPVGWVLSDQRSPSAREPSGGAEPAGPEAAPAGPDGAALPPGDAAEEAEPIPTPLLSRAFRTTSQVST
ncbi:MAG: hypothetical protein OXG47_00100 [bacterium]|nr:hypothetical protein [bacterium]